MIVGEPGVLVPATEAAALAHALRLLDGTNGGLPDHLIERLRQFETVAAGRRLPGSEVPEVPVRVAKRNLSDVSKVGVTAATRAIGGISDRGVRGLCERGTLLAEKVAGRWHIDPASLAAYVASRRSA